MGPIFLDFEFFDNYENREICTKIVVDKTGQPVKYLLTSVHNPARWKRESNNKEYKTINRPTIENRILYQIQVINESIKNKERPARIRWLKSILEMYKKQEIEFIKLNDEDFLLKEISSALKVRKYKIFKY
jgi:hypothetical protein